MFQKPESEVQPWEGCAAPGGLQGRVLPASSSSRPPQPSEVMAASLPLCLPSRGFPRVCISALLSLMRTLD